MEYLNGAHDGRQDGEVLRDRLAMKEDRLIPRLLLYLQDGGLYGHRLEERLGELGFEGMHEGEMYRILWQMEQEGMVFCDREDGSFRLPQQWYELTEAGKAYLDPAQAHSRATRRRRTFFSRLQDELLGWGRIRG